MSLEANPSIIQKLEMAPLIILLGISKTGANPQKTGNEGEEGDETKEEEDGGGVLPQTRPTTSTPEADTRGYSDYQSVGEYIITDRN